MMGARVRKSSLSPSSRSLRNQVNDLEAQLMLRRQTVRSLVAETNQRVVSWLTSPRMLLAAVGVGVAVEQTSHHRGWSAATVIEAANAGMGLLFALSNSVPQATERAPRLHS
jgi:uncharacterized membrane protein